MINDLNFDGLVELVNSFVVGEDDFDMSQVLPLTRWKDMQVPEREYFSCDESEDEEDSDDEPIIIPKKKPKKVAPPRLIIPKKQTVPRIRRRPKKRALPPPHPPGPQPGPKKTKNWESISDFFTELITWLN